MGYKIKVNGREYDRPDQMPPEDRALYDEVMARMSTAFVDRDGSGIPDVTEGKGPIGSKLSEVNRIVLLRPEVHLKIARKGQTASNDPIEPSSSESKIRTLMILVGFLVGALIVAYFVMRMR